MSRQNITTIQDLKSGVLVTFKTDKGLRHYRYGAVAGRKIRDENRNPAEFKATEIKGVSK
jgi:hypothetical protein